MATNVQLVNSVTLSLTGTSLTGSGQFTTADGHAVSESVDLTVLMTPAAKQAVLLLVELLQQQYPLWRNNLLSSDQCMLADSSLLSPLLAAVATADTTRSYMGSQSIKVTTPGAVLGEGVQVALPAVPRAAQVSVTALLLLPTGVAVQGVLSDSANSVESYQEVLPATTPVSYSKSSAARSATSAAVTGGATPAWQLLTVSLTAGAAALPSLRLALGTGQVSAGAWWLGALQVSTS